MKGNHLSFADQCRIVYDLAEGSSIRSLEQTTRHHRDSIMRLGVRVGKGCAVLHDELMRELPCKEIQVDEMWSYCGKKQKNVTPEEDAAGFGDRWIYLALDPVSKVVPAFAVGKRDFTTTYKFGHDLASRLANRVQLTADGMNDYREVVLDAFGPDNVDFAQLVKSYTHENTAFTERKFSPPPMTSARPRRICGEPDPKRITTSHVEAHNMAVRNFTKRVARLTVCYSKKPENMDAAIALNVVYLNFVRGHWALKMTPAMALGIENDFWTMPKLVAAALERCPPQNISDA